MAKIRISKIVLEISLIRSYIEGINKTDLYARQFAAWRIHF
jgi:hypothetical protein